MRGAQRQHARAAARSAGIAARRAVAAPVPEFGRQQSSGYGGYGGEGHGYGRGHPAPVRQQPGQLGRGESAPALGAGGSARRTAAAPAAASARVPPWRDEQIRNLDNDYQSGGSERISEVQRRIANSWRNSRSGGQVPVTRCRLRSRGGSAGDRQPGRRQRVYDRESGAAARLQDQGSTHHEEPALPCRPALLGAGLCLGHRAGPDPGRRQFDDGRRGGAAAQAGTGTRNTRTEVARSRARPQVHRGRREHGMFEVQVAQLAASKATDPQRQELRQHAGGPAHRRQQRAGEDRQRPRAWNCRRRPALGLRQRHREAGQEERRGIRPRIRQARSASRRTRRTSRCSSRPART